MLWKKNIYKKLAHICKWESQVAGDGGGCHTHSCRMLALHACVSRSVWEPLHRPTAAPVPSSVLLLFPKITRLCTGRPWKPYSFPAARQKQSLFHHRKGENILTNACVLDGWQSCHGKEAAAPFGDGRWGAGSGNFWDLLAAQVWRRATHSPTPHGRSALNRKQIDTERSVPAPWFLWNECAIRRPEPIGCTTHVHLCN